MIRGYQAHVSGLDVQKVVFISSKANQGCKNIDIYSAIDRKGLFSLLFEVNRTADSPEYIRSLHR